MTFREHIEKSRTVTVGSEDYVLYSDVIEILDEIEQYINEVEPIISILKTLLY